MISDEIEWSETLDLLKSNEDIILSNLTFGEFVSIKKETFDKFVEEINYYRVKDGDLEEGVEIITIGEKNEELVQEEDNPAETESSEDSKVDDED